MAYLHCHSCEWSQDDFYNKDYNPLTKIWGDVQWLWRPRILEIDVESYNPRTIFSWKLLVIEIVKDIRIALEMKWWTFHSWKKDWAQRTDKFPACPKCGKQDFDID